MCAAQNNNILETDMTEVEHCDDDTRVLQLPISLRLLRRLHFPHKLGVMDRLFGRTLAREGVCFVSTSRGNLWKLNLQSASQRWLVYGEYLGSAAAKWMDSWLASGGLVLDSGANIGQTVQQFAGVHGIEVIAVEPNPVSAQWLRDSIAKNPAMRVRIEVSGLGERTGELMLRLPHFTGEAEAQATFRDDWYRSRRVDTVAVPVTTIDELLDRLKRPHIRLWKLDVEGWEVAVLRGALKTLTANEIDAIYVEVHPTNRTEVSKILRAHGYALFTLNRRGRLIEHATALPEMQDYLAISLAARP